MTFSIGSDVIRQPLPEINLKYSLTNFDPQNSTELQRYGNQSRWNTLTYIYIYI